MNEWIIFAGSLDSSCQVFLFNHLLHCLQTMSWAGLVVAAWTAQCPARAAVTTPAAVHSVDWHRYGIGNVKTNQEDGSEVSTYATYIIACPQVLFWAPNGCYRCAADLLWFPEPHRTLEQDAGPLTRLGWLVAGTSSRAIVSRPYNI